MPKKIIFSIIFFLIINISLSGGGLNLPTSPEDFDRLNPPTGVDTTFTGAPDSQKGLGDEEIGMESEGKTYYITAGDILIVKLPDDKEFTEHEVNFDGYITLPKLGNFK